ncbi:hypothetical protein GCM10007171_07530 [Dickeya fangzhongdai]|nr:hypothetical protein GCM10007171_07530 [Dickeya fangzhongdai]
MAIVCHEDGDKSADITAGRRGAGDATIRFCLATGTEQVNYANIKTMRTPKLCGYRIEVLQQNRDDDRVTQNEKKIHA